MLLQVFDATIFYGLRQAVIVSALWLIPLLIFPRRARALSAAIGVLLWATSLVGLGYFCIYQQEFSQSVIFILFESNPAEAEEYFAQYFVWWMVPAFLIYSVGAWWLWRRIRPLATGRGQAWALSHLLRAIEVDFADVLAKKNATVSVRQIIRELEAAQEPLWSPMVLNGSGYGVLANHSLVMANYISRANAAIIDLRTLLSQG